MTPTSHATPQLYLGRDRTTALALGPRQFRNLETAVRFAMEQAAPISLRGALLLAGGRRLGRAQIARLYHSLGTGARRALGPELAELCEAV